MTVTYGITEEIYILGDSKRISYGIAAYADTETDNTTTIVASVHDITSDKQKISELVEMCNRLELSAIHLNDVVENFLSG